MLALLLAASLALSAPSGGNVTLNNGLHVVVVRDPIAPVVTVQVNYRAGSADDPPGMAGTAHAMEHLMFRGDRVLSGDQMEEIMFALGGSFNAETFPDSTWFRDTVPAPDLPIALRFEATRMSAASQEDPAWTAERRVIEREMEMRDSHPLRRFVAQAAARLFEGTPYARAVGGDAATVAKIPRTALSEFHRRWYGPNNAIVVIAGDVDVKKTVALVRAVFSGIPRRPVPEHAPSFSLARSEKSTIRIPGGFPYPMVTVAMRLPGYRDKQWAAAQILEEALSAGRPYAFSAFVRRTRARAAEFEVPYRSAMGAIGVAVVVPPENADPSAAAADVYSYLGALGYMLPPEYIDAAKRVAVNRVEKSVQSIPNLAGTWSDALVNHGVTPAQEASVLKGVTAAQVRDAPFQRYLAGRIVIGIIEPGTSGPPGALSSGTQDHFTPEEPGIVALPPWAQQLQYLPPVPPFFRGVTDTRLANGLRLIVVPDAADRWVTVSGEVRHLRALQEPPGKEGVGRMLDRLFLAGPSSEPGEPFLSALARINADERAGTNFSLSVPTAHFERGIALLAENLLDPDFDGRLVAQLRAQLGAYVADNTGAPDETARRLLSAALFPPGDPALREPTAKSIDSVSLADVEAYYRAVFRPDVTTIVVVGDVSAERVRAAVERGFGRWSAAGAAPATDLPAVPPNRASAHTVRDANRTDDRVQLSETLAIAKSDPDYDALTLGVTLLGGDMLGTRLMRAIRNTAGETYGIDAELSTHSGRTVFSVGWTCAPNKTGVLRDLVVREIRRLQTDPAAERELRRTKAALIRGTVLNETSTHAIAEELASNATSGEDLKDSRVRAARYASITAEQVRAAVAKWLRTDGFAQIVQGPEPPPSPTP